MTELLKALLRMALWLAVFLLCLYALAPAGEAAYKPAPDRIIKAAQQTNAPARGTVARRAWIICRYFTRSTCRAAVNVAWCESTLRPWAANGQYRGVFQMGAAERNRYGHGRTAWHQAKAARAYWRKANWRPWVCRPY
jgi:hypothetical protein